MCEANWPQLNDRPCRIWSKSRCAGEVLLLWSLSAISLPQGYWSSALPWSKAGLYYLRTVCRAGHFLPSSRAPLTPKKCWWRRLMFQWLCSLEMLKFCCTRDLAAAGLASTSATNLCLHPDCPHCISCYCEAPLSAPKSDGQLSLRAGF